MTQESLTLSFVTLTILPSLNRDFSIVRAGEDYDITTSTFDDIRACRSIIHAICGTAVC